MIVKRTRTSRSRRRPKSAPAVSVEYQTVPRQDRGAQSSVDGGGRGMRVAMTVEQSWHLVPGGIAISTVELLRALNERDDLDLVGIAAYHRHPAPSAVSPPVAV